MQTPSNPTAHDERISQHIYETSLVCFRRQGYGTVTMQEIAAQAGLALETVHSHFPDKKSIAQALYQRKVDAVVAHIEALPAGILADRFYQVLAHAMQTMSHDREAVMAVFADAMVEDHDFDLMSGSPAQRLSSAYHRLVLESEDALREPQALEMGTVLYTLQMLVLVFWCYDRSPGQMATRNLMSLVRDLFKQLRPLFFLPMIPQAIAQLAAIIQPAMEPASVGAAAQKDARDGEHQDLDVHRD